MDKATTEMTKTELEMQDFSWNNIIGVAIIMGAIYVGYRMFKKK